MSTLHPAAPLIAIAPAGALGVLTALSGTLDLLCVALAVYWSIALFRLLVMMATIPTARRGLSLSPPPSLTERVCVIVPAHNEEAMIGALVASLCSQDYPHLSVVLSLDRCTDRSADAARRAAAGDSRIHLLEVHSCPDGWAGKVNAVCQGVQTAPARAADLLLFADADTHFEPQCIRACVGLLEHRRLDFLSLLSTLSYTTWFERLAQPAATFELVRQYPVTRANRRNNPRAFANGQFMLFRRAAYDAIGGHAAVKDELLEDLALARRLAEAGRVSGLFLSGGLLRCRMYESWPAFREGWKRIYVESAKRRLSRLRLATTITAVWGSALPIAALLNLCYSLALAGSGSNEQSTGIIGLWFGGVALGAWFATLLLAYRAASAPLWAIPAYPVGAGLVARILSEAASDLRKRVPVRWAGREYVREPR